MKQNSGAGVHRQAARSSCWNEDHPTAKELTAALHGEWKHTKGKAKCPAHDDDNPSLEITEKNGCTLVICRAGCPQHDVIAALKKKGLWPEARHVMNGHANGHAKAAQTIVATYDYADEAGATQFQVVRFAPKVFRQRRPDGKGGYVWNLNGVRPLIYNLIAVKEAIATEQIVVVVEGEKDADNLAKIGITATCNSAGADKWKAEHATFLEGAYVVIIPDNDKAGHKHADTVARSLSGKAASVRLVELPDLPLKGDVSDWINTGGSAEALWALIDQAPEWQERQPSRPAPQPDDDLPHWQVEPWNDDVSGAEILDGICTVLRRHMFLPEHADVAIAAWILHAWTIEAFDWSPLLILVSPTKQCGKTTLLTVIYWLTPWSEIMSSVSASSLFRAIDEHREFGRVPTFLIDECDAFIKHDEDMRGMLNSGHMRHAAWVRRTESIGRTHKPKRYSTWAPKVLATIRAIADTLMDRAVIVMLRRKPKSEPRQQFRMRDTEELAALRRKCLRWANDHRSRLEAAEPNLPEALSNRPADNWRPLIAIADAAAGRWPKAVRDAAVRLTCKSRDDDRGTDVLRDIRRIFNDTEFEWIGAENLVQRLIEMPETPWAEYRNGEKPITSRGFWRLLDPFNIASHKEREGNRYYRRDFEDAWASYLPKESDDNEQQGGRS